MSILARTSLDRTGFRIINGDAQHVWFSMAPSDSREC